MNKLISLVLISFLGLIGCQTINTDRNDLVWITKSLGTKQCSDSNAEIKLQQLKEDLEQQRIRVFAAEIGTDQLFHITLCGADDGKMAIFQVQSAELKKAEKLGYMQKSAN